MSDIKQVIVVRRDLKMRKGKIGAQCAHAAMKFLIDNDESKQSDQLFVKLSIQEATWVRDLFTKIVVGVDSEDELQDLIFKAKLANIEVHPIIDSGITEFHNVATLTCAAFGPAESDEIDRITGNLKLL